jgi:hypothetical protein
MTRQDLLTRIRQMSDTLYATVDYPDELLKDLASMVHADEWRKVLGVSPYERTQSLQVSLDSALTFPWSALTTGTGNDIKNVHRVLEVSDSAGRELTYAQPDRLRLGSLVAGGNTTTIQLWTKNGSRVQTTGTQSGGTLTVLVSYTPTPVGDLASDADTVDWPTEWKPILFYETAALALSKGGRETQEARDLLQMADMLRQKMLQAFGRQSANPYIIGADDNAFEWGG